MSTSNRDVQWLRNIATRSIREVGLNQCVKNKLWEYVPAKPARWLRKAKPAKFISMTSRDRSEPPEYCWLDNDNDVCYLPFIWIEYTNGDFERFFVKDRIDNDASYADKKNQVLAQIRVLGKIIGHIKTQFDRLITGQQLEDLAAKALLEIDTEIKVSEEQAKAADYAAQVAASQD